MTSGAASPRRSQRILDRLDFARVDYDRLALPALGIALIASGLLLLHLTRGTTFWVDEWNFITGRRGNSVNTFLSPYQGHFSLVPVVIYRLFFDAFGISSYTPYRALVIALSLVVAILLFAYARRRVGAVCALLLTTLLLFLGPGWQNTMWAFQSAWLIVAAAGIGALMLLDRRSLKSDIAACVLTLVAVSSTSVGIAFAVGIAVDVALTRRRWRDAWIPGIPLLLYAIWALHYHPTPIAWSAVTAVPSNVPQAAAAALSALTGISGIAPFNQNGNALIYGVPLLVVGLVLAAWIATRRGLSARVVSLVVILAVFTVMLTLVRAGADGLLSSRYLYFYCLLMALLIAEVARGMRPSLPAQAALTGVCCLAVVSNIGILRASGDYIRESGAQTKGALTALDLDRTTTPPDTLAQIALYPYMRLSAGAYFAASDALGTPAYTVSQLLSSDAKAQSTADAQMVSDGIVTFGPETGATRSATFSITASAVTNGTASRAAGCVRLMPIAAMLPGASASFVVSVPRAPARLSVTAGRAGVAVSIRRFAPTFTSLGRVQPGRSGVVTIRRDSAAQPWYLQLSSIAPVQVCALGL